MFSKLHPMVLFLRNALLGTWFFLAIFVKEAFFALMGIQLVYIVIMIIFRPYKKVVDFVRSTIIEAGIGFILVSRFIEANYVDVTVTSDTWGKFYNLSAYVEYGFFIVGLVMSGAALIYHICRIGKSKEGRVNPDDD